MHETAVGHDHPAWHVAESGVIRASIARSRRRPRPRRALVSRTQVPRADGALAKMIDVERVRARSRAATAPRNTDRSCRRTPARPPAGVPAGRRSSPLWRPRGSAARDPAENTRARLPIAFSASPSANRNRAPSASRQKPSRTGRARSTATTWVVVAGRVSLWIKSLPKRGRAPYSKRSALVVRSSTNVTRRVPQHHRWSQLAAQLSQQAGARPSLSRAGRR